MITRATLIELEPRHWTDDMPGWSCDCCGADQTEDDEAFNHPNPKYVTLRWCKVCHEAKDE